MKALILFIIISDHYKGNWLQALARRLYPGISTRVTAPFLLATVVVAGIGVFIVTRLVAGSIQERLNNQLVDSAKAASNTVVEIERQHISILRAMVFTEGIDLAIQERDIERIDRLLRPVAVNSAVDEVIVFDSRGQGIFQLTRSSLSFTLEYQVSEPDDLTGRDGVVRVIKGEVDALGDKYVDVVRGENGYIFYFNSPVLNEDGVLVGGISVGITTNKLIRQMSEQALSSLTLYLPEGGILDTTFRTVPEADLLLPSAESYEIYQKVRRTNPTEERNLNQVTYQVLYVPLEIRSQQIGILAVALPKNFIADRIGTSRNALAALFSTLFVGIAVMGLMVSRSISNPVKQLVSTTRAIREGDLSKRVGLETPDELGELSISFDHMTEQLVESNEEIKRLYHEQVQETARRDAVLSSISDALLVLNPARKITLLNEAAENLMHQCEREESANLRFAQLCSTPEQLSHPQTVKMLNQSFSVLATPVTMPSEELLGHVIVFRDITALVEAERLKDEIILQLSHELRTPLSAAKGYNDLVLLLKNGLLDEQGNHFVASTSEQLAVLERMINQVIDVSKMIAGNFHVEMENIELTEILRNVIDENLPMMNKRQHQMITFLPGNRLWLRGDRTRLAQVADHLLRNACSYTPPGGTIELNVKIRDGYSYIMVHDNGVGIDDDELPRVFDCMFRGRSAEAGPTDTRGLGLGLYIAKQVVEAHRGAISVRSRRGYGTTAAIELPLRGGNGR